MVIKEPLQKKRYQRLAVFDPLKVVDVESEGLSIQLLKMQIS